MAVQKVATQVIEDAAVTDAKLNTTGLGLHRNFIIDGDFTQWPTGTSFPSIAHVTYGPALWQQQRSGSNTPFDVNRSTNVPTIAYQSGHQSFYSMEIDCTTALGSPASTDYHEMRYHVTGTDFGHLHQQTVTLNFWWYSTKTGTCSGTIRNSAQNRVYPFSFTVSSTNTWEEKSVTIALDTSGSWLFTEADKGCLVTFNLVAGSGRTATAGSWGGTFASGASSTANHADSTSNIVRIAQVGLYLGSTAPTFTSPPVATVKDQVEYYVERRTYSASGSAHVANGYADGTTVFRGAMFYPVKRKIPIVSVSGATHFGALYGSGSITGGTPSFSAFLVTTQSFQAYISGLTGLTAREGCIMCQKGTQESWILLDARH